MNTFTEYLQTIHDDRHRMRLEEICNFIEMKFPLLQQRIAWNQPMYIEHGTFIIGFSCAKKHLSVAPEHACIEQFSQEIQALGYIHSKELLYIPWENPVPFSLLEKMIIFNREEKAQYKTFWRKK